MTSNLATIPTLDHGDVTVPEPAWCIGHADQPRGYRIDLTHSGPELRIGPAGEPLFTALVTQHPFSSGSRETSLYVEDLDITGNYSPAELDELAAGLVEAAAQLRHQARWLSVLRGGTR